MELAILLIALAIIWLFWWLVIHTEGAYLGQRAVIWLYDLYAGRYDAIKGNDDVDEHIRLAQPLLNRLAPRTDPLVLDVATGTGRIPLALCQHARFGGHIVGLDLSRRMLARAERKLAEQHFSEYATFIWGAGDDLPFADGAFDVVTVMEALEFMPEPIAALTEALRVLKPGGVLLMTNRRNMRLMPGRIWSDAALRALLVQHGMTEVDIEMWQVDYKLVWARKM